MESQFKPGQTVRWCASLRADWVSGWSALGTEPPVGRVVRVIDSDTDPELGGFCGMCGGGCKPGDDPRCPGPFVLVAFWDPEGTAYAEHELEEA